MDREFFSLGCVITVKRRLGIGERVGQAGLYYLEEFWQTDKVRIEDQTDAKRLYEKVGITQASDEFLEDDIPHIEMIKEF